MYNYDIQHSWLTIDCALDELKSRGFNLAHKDIYHYAQNLHLTLSIHFQSPIIIRAVKIEHKLTSSFDIQAYNLIEHICQFNPNWFNHFNKLTSHKMATPIGDFIYPLDVNSVWDLSMQGSEQLYNSQLLAKALNLPIPVLANNHCGIIIKKDTQQLFQLYENSSLIDRLNKQLKNINSSFNNRQKTAIHKFKQSKFRKNIKRKMQVKSYPLYYMPDDAFLVITRKNLEVFIGKLAQSSPELNDNEKITTPLARYLWLACINHPSIGEEMIQHPYKLITIFESWAERQGITDKFNANTLKNILKRGHPK